jgi:glycosyltransferase involved in cell wall biosynthesis
VLSTRSGGPEELVRASGGGVLLDTYEPEELATAAAALLGDPKRLTAMRAAGRAYVEREHTPARLRERLATML